VYECGKASVERQYILGVFAESVWKVILQSCVVQWLRNDLNKD